MEIFTIFGPGVYIPTRPEKSTTLKHLGGGSIALHNANANIDFDYGPSELTAGQSTTLTVAKIARAGKGAAARVMMTRAGE